MKTIIIILLSILSLGLKAQDKRIDFERACLSDTIWITINGTPHYNYDDAICTAKSLDRMIGSYEIISDVQGYWISCKIVRNPRYSNYGYWLKHDKLCPRINKKEVIFVE